MNPDRDWVHKRAEGNLDVDGDHVTLPCPFCGAGGFIVVEISQTAVFETTAQCSECGEVRACSVAYAPENSPPLTVIMRHVRPGNA